MTVLPTLDIHASTKDKIIQLLSSNPALNTKRIHNLLKKQYSLNITYQAVHKTLRQMCEQGMLVTEGKGYYLSQKWIEQLCDFVNKYNKVKHGDLGKENILDTSSYLTEVKTIMLNNLKQFDDYYYNLRNSLIDNIDKFPEKERVIFYHLSHCYYALAYPTRETELMEKLASKKARMYFLARGRTKIDKYIQNFYKNSNAEVVLDVDCAQTRELWIFPKVIFEVYYSYRFIELFNQLYSETQDISQIKFQEFIKQIYSVKDPIQIIENKNELAVESILKHSWELIKNRKIQNHAESSVPYGSPLAKQIRYYNKGSDLSNLNLNSLKIDQVNARIRNIIQERKIKKLVYKECGYINLVLPSKIAQNNNNQIYVYKINGLSGIMRKDNPVTWKFGTSVCKRIKEKTDCIGFISSDELTSKGGQKLAYGFTKHSLKELMKFATADENKDLLILLVYPKSKAVAVGNSLLELLSKQLGLPLAKE